MDEGYDVVIGSRQIEGARRFGEGMARHFRGRVFNWVVRLVAVGGFQDTQCGFKCFRGDVAEEIFSRQMTRGLGFDVEILYLATRRRLRILEMPIDWHHQQTEQGGLAGGAVFYVEGRAGGENPRGARPVRPCGSSRVTMAVP